MFSRVTGCRRRNVTRLAGRSVYDTLSDPASESAVITARMSVSWKSMSMPCAVRRTPVESCARSGAGAAETASHAAANPHAARRQADVCME